MNQKLKVWIIDPDIAFQKECAEKLRPFIPVITSGMVRTRTDVAEKISGVTHIVVDGDERLPKLLRLFFAGPIIAASSQEEFNELLMLAGCSHRSSKAKAMDLVLSLVDSGFSNEPLPVKKSFRILSWELIELIVEFLRSAKRPQKIEETRGFLAEIERVLREINRPGSVTEFKKIKDKLDELEVCPPDILSSRYADCLEDLREKTLSLYSKIFLS